MPPDTPRSHSLITRKECGVFGRRVFDENQIPRQSNKIGDGIKDGLTGTPGWVAADPQSNITGDKLFIKPIGKLLLNVESRYFHGHIVSPATFRCTASDCHQQSGPRSPLTIPGDLVQVAKLCG